jgi:hypothetical protein
MIDETMAGETAYHCTATWHLARMTRAAEMIYSLACVISKTSHRFFCSAPNLAQYIGYERRQIYRGLQELEDAGFLELESRQTFQSSVYGVILHKAWAQNHPGRCATKQAFPWDGEGDELGRKMFALSGGRHRFLNHEIQMLRKSGLSEELILTEWQDFIGSWKPLNRQDARYAFSRFYDLLKVKNGNPNPLQTLVFRLYQMSGYVFSGSYKASLSWIASHLSEAEIVGRFNDHLANTPETRRAVRAFCNECLVQTRDLRLRVNEPKSDACVVEPA